MNKFIKDMMERAIKTASETILATLGTTTVFGQTDWKITGLIAIGSTLLSIVASLLSKNIGNKNTAGLVKK